MLGELLEFAEDRSFVDITQRVLHLVFMALAIAEGV